MSCFWKHDWVVVDSSTRTEENNHFGRKHRRIAWENSGKDLKDLPPMPPMPGCSHPTRLENRVCLTCSIVDRQIDQYQRELEAKLEKERRRLNRALEIMGEYYEE